MMGLPSRMAPGSAAARMVGCRCPAAPNADGLGYQGGRRDACGEILYVIDIRCQIHAPGAEMARRVGCTCPAASDSAWSTQVEPGCPVHSPGGRS
jgi:hypothetical protein